MLFCVFCNDFQCWHLSFRILLYVLHSQIYLDGSSLLTLSVFSLFTRLASCLDEGSRKHPKFIEVLNKNYIPALRIFIWGTSLNGQMKSLIAHCGAQERGQ